MIGFSALLQSLLDCISQFAKYGQAKVENQEATSIISDKNDLEKAGNIAEQIIEIAQKYNIPAEIAMEKEMACSIGVCRGCVIELKNGKNASVCKDGPVFNGEEIKW